MADSVTVTAKVGPGATITAQAYQNCQLATFDMVNNLLVVQLSNGQRLSFDINAATTITATLASGNFAFTVS